MSTVEIPLNNYTYKFRKLTFEEEFALDVKPGENGANAALAAALVEVSGRTVTRDDAQQIMHVLPQPVLARVWVMYKAGLPADRFFVAKGLYTAPEPVALARKSEEDEERRDGTADRAMSDLERRFGEQEVAAAKLIERRMFEDARRRGTLIRATDHKEGSDASKN